LNGEPYLLAAFNCYRKLTTFVATFCRLGLKYPFMSTKSSYRRKALLAYFQNHFQIKPKLKKTKQTNKKTQGQSLKIPLSSIYLHSKVQIIVVDQTSHAPVLNLKIQTPTIIIILSSEHLSSFLCEANGLNF